MVAIAYHTTLEEVWQQKYLAAFLTSPQQNVPFDRLEWWQGLVDHCGCLPFIAEARSDQNCAILPLQRTGKGTLEGLANWYSFGLRPLLSSSLHSLPLLTALASDLKNHAYRITLHGLSNEDSGAQYLLKSLQQAGWSLFQESTDLNHILHTRNLGFPEYLDTRPGPLRTTLKRKAHKVDTQIFTHFDPQAWAAYEDIYAQSWKPEESSPSFLRNFAQQEGLAGRLRLGIASTKDAPVAAQLWTVEGGIAYIHKLAYIESAKPLSPGTTLTAALMRHALEVDHVSLVDFGTGNDRYKYDWMDDFLIRRRIIAFRPYHPKNWRLLAKKKLQDLAELSSSR